MRSASRTGASEMPSRPATFSWPMRSPGTSAPETIASRRCASACWAVVFGTTRPLSASELIDRGASGAERRGAGERAADDERVHVRGALVGDDGLEVVHVADDRILERDPVGAEHLAGGAGDVER